MKRPWRDWWTRLCIPDSRCNRHVPIDQAELGFGRRVNAPNEQMSKQRRSPALGSECEAPHTARGTQVPCGMKNHNKPTPRQMLCRFLWKRSAWSAARRLAFVLSVAPALIGVANTIVDPLQFLHAPWLQLPKITAQPRFERPSIARYSAYDTVVIGSSTVSGMSSSGVQKYFPGRAINLFIDGAFAHEERLMLDVALRTGQVRRVLWGVDFFSFAVRPDQTNTQFPAFLYQRDPLGWLPYVFSEFTTRMTFQILTGIATIDPKWVASPEDLIPRVPDRSLQTDSLLAAVEEQSTDDHWKSIFNAFGDADSATIANNVMANLSSTIRNNESVEFSLFFPPYSAIFTAYLAKRFHQRFETMLATRALICREMRRFPNARLFDFQIDRSKVSDLRRYADLVHYDAATNDQIARDLATGVGLVDSDCGEQKIRAIVAEINSPARMP